jgi:hypothetical protein
MAKLALYHLFRTCSRFHAYRPKMLSLSGMRMLETDTHAVANTQAHAHAHFRFGSRHVTHHTAHYSLAHVIT